MESACIAGTTARSMLKFVNLLLLRSLPQNLQKNDKSLFLNHNDVILVSDTLAAALDNKYNYNILSQGDLNIAPM